MRARAIGDYRTQYADPIRFARGDVVVLGARDTEWPAFAWTTTANDNAGWAAVDWLQAQDDGQAVALRDYSAQEPDVRAGGTLVLSHELGEWWWCRHEDGRCGWVPARDLRRLPPAHE